MQALYITDRILAKIHLLKYLVKTQQQLKSMILKKEITGWLDVRHRIDAERVIIYVNSSWKSAIEPILQ